MLAMWGCAAPAMNRGASSFSWDLSRTPLDRTAAELGNSTAEHLAWAKAVRARIGEVQGPRTIANTLVSYNEMMMHLDAAANDCALFRQVHPDKAVRDVATEGEQQVAAYLTELNLDRGLYDAFRAVDLRGADAGTRYFVEKRIRDFRRAGVDKDDETRRRIAALNEEIVKIGQAFAKNKTDDENRREILLDSLADLDGLPKDWIGRHPPASDGKIHVSTRTPDVIPFMIYARNDEARRRLYMESRNRGYPQNLEVLNLLLAKRYELSRLLGYGHYAEYITEDKMIGSAANAAAFIDRIAQISAEPARRDYHRLLERKRKDDPAATKVQDWEKDYYEELVRAETFAFDSQSIRPYLSFPNVQQGLFELTQKMFGLTYRRVDGLKLWNESVSAWDVYDGDAQVGRFYLDLHPRPDKYGHAAQFDFRTGIAGRRIPQAVLVCNFPNPADSPDGLALMEHDEVVTFFHEFGHLLHSLLAGRQPWIGNSGISTEWDFVEAPSQMLEEWCYDYQSLRLFARHHETGEPIPADLVEKLRRASDFGKGIYTAHQMFYAAVSLNYYSRDPSNIDTTALMRELQSRYSPFEYVPDTHFQCSFGHLDGYSAIYYTYMWSKVIAKDLFSRFEKDGLLNTGTARLYRDAVLTPGGSKKAAELVRSFLGRPHAFDAFETWLNRS
jgi:thimet oligopeptidase